MVYHNLEKGMKWERFPLANEEFRTYDIVAADLNADGSMDIMEANSDAINRYYFNRTKE